MVIPPVKPGAAEMDHREGDFLSSYKETVRQWIDGAVSAQAAISCSVFGNGLAPDALDAEDCNSKSDVSDLNR